MEDKTQATAPRQFPLPLDSFLLRGLAPSERARAVSLLAQLLLEAAGEGDREADDEYV